MRALVAVVALTSVAAPAWAAEKIKVAVMDLKGSEGIPKEFRESLTAIIPQTLEELGAFKAISRQDIEQMLSLERVKDALGCSDASCMAEIGGALGADYMVSGSVIFVVDSYLVQLQLVSIKAARVDARISRSYKGGPQGLFDEMATATKLLMRDALAARAGSLQVVLREEGATIKLDGKIVGVSPAPVLTVAGGTHVLSVEKEGFVVFSRDVEIAEKKTTTANVTLQPSQEFKVAYERRARLWRALGYSALGVGAAGFVTAGVSLGVGAVRATALRKDVNAYNASDTRTGNQQTALTARKSALAGLDALSLSGLIIGAVGVAAGLSIVFLGDDPNRFATKVEIGATLSGLRVYGEF